jgi:hypothetical protein
MYSRIKTFLPQWLPLLALCASGTGAFGQVSPAPQVPQTLRGREFSAEIVSRDAAGLQVVAAARIYVSDRKVRIETPQASAGFFLFDADAGTALFVLPAQRVFMNAKQSSRLTQLFVPIDSPDACETWRSAAKNAVNPGVVIDWRCERMEDGMVNGRRAAGYRVAASENASGLRWVDSDLGFPIKVLTADGASIVLEHIRSEPQPASLFSVPPNFRNFDPQALLERIKRSDAWVQP